MNHWLSIHDFALAELRRRCSLQPVRLKHQFPERPWRLLGLLKFDGEVFSAERLVRALVLKTSVMGKGARSLLLCPRPEMNFPVFSNETILMGKQVLFLVDVQQVFPASSRCIDGLLEQLQTIRAGFPDVLRQPVAVSGEIARGFSPAAVYVKLSPDRHERADSLYRQYLRCYLDALDAAAPAPAETRAAAQQAFDAYAQLVISHDPAMRLLGRLFGAAGARERAYDMFFGK